MAQYAAAKNFTANARAKRPAGCKGPLVAKALTNKWIQE